MIPDNLKPCKTEKVCDDNDATIYPMMKYLIEHDGMTERGAADIVSKEYSGTVTPERAASVHRRRASASHDAPAKPQRKQTDTETKKQLRKTASEIKAGKVSDDDVKILDNAIASAINEETIAVRTGTSTHTAVKRANKKRKGVSLKEVDNFKRLDGSLKIAIDGLTAWADDQMQPESETEKEHAIAILAKGTNLIIQFARLGADILGIHDTFIQGDYNEKEQHNKFRVIP